MLTKKRKKAESENFLENQCKKLFKVVKSLPTEEAEHSLEQPSPYKAIKSITTYGAYEEPI